MNCTLAVDGMSCGACAARLERALTGAPGVRAARVDFASARAFVELAPEADEAGLAKIAEEEGFGLSRVDATPEQRDALVRLAVAAFFSMNAMMASWAVYLGDPEPGLARTLALASGALAAPALVAAGGGAVRGAISSVRTGVYGADLLISLGAGLAVALSLGQLAAGGDEVYFDTAAMLFTLHVAGRALEGAVRRRAVDATRALLDRAAPTVRMVDGAEVDARAVPPGALVGVRPGERLALDGVIVDGRSTVDRAWLTGESVPVAVGPGDAVHAGELVGEGALRLRVTAGVGARRLDRVAEAVRGLLGARTPLQRTADRLAARLVPALLGGAALTAVAQAWWTGDPVRGALIGVSVVVVTCPCALGVAAPLVVAVAAGRAAGRGILLRDADALERAAGVRAVWFDKTGTLTGALPEVLAVLPADGVDEATLRARIAGIEDGSEHPLGRALRGLSAAPLPTAPPRATPGRGIEADTADGLLRVGAPSWLGLPSTDGPYTEVAATLAGRPLGVVRVGAALRPGAAEAVAALRARGLAVRLLTGDGRAAARAQGAAAGFTPDEVAWGLSPEDKAAAVEAGGPGVLFVGDGLNDAPALAAAWLGAAVPGATDVARAAGQVVLLEGGPERVLELLDVAAGARRAARQNLAWAVGYNLLAVPFAALGLAGPLTAAAAMTASSLAVTFNAARLARSLS